MKRILYIIIILIININTIFAQDVNQLKLKKQTAITVNNQPNTWIDKFLTSWAAQNPGEFTNRYQKLNKTTTNSDEILVDNYYIKYLPKNGYIQITATSQYDNFLQTCYWNLQNNNKLFAIYVRQCNEKNYSDDDDNLNCDEILLFYEYITSKNQLEYRPEIAQKVKNIVGNGYLSLPSTGKDIDFYDVKSNSYKSVKWNGNGF